MSTFMVGNASFVVAAGIMHRVANNIVQIQIKDGIDHGQLGTAGDA